MEGSETMNLPEGKLDDMQSPPRVKHRKRNPDELKIYKWKESDMIEAIKDVKEKNMSVGKAAELHKVTKGLLKKLIDNPDRPLTVTQGRKLTMSAANEESLRNFCDHAWQMGMPRTQDMLSEDIRDFAVRRNVPCPYKVRGPGLYYFKRFCIRPDGSLLILPTRKMVMDEFNRDVSLKNWSDELKAYIRHCNGGYLLESKENMFMFESIVFEIVDEDGERYMTIGYLLNPAGGVVSQFILYTSGHLSSEIKAKYRQNAHFLETLSGWFDQDSMAFVMDRLKGYMKMRQLTGSALLVIDQNIKKFCKYVDWLHAQDLDVILHCPPKSVITLMHSLTLGVLHKYREAIEPLLNERYVDKGLFWNEEKFVELHFEVMSKVNLKTEVPRTFRQLNINHIQRAKKTKDQEQTCVASTSDVQMPQIEPFPIEDRLPSEALARGFSTSQFSTPTDTDSNGQRFYSHNSESMEPEMLCDVPEGQMSPDYTSNLNTQHEDLAEDLNQEQNDSEINDAGEFCTAYEMDEQVHCDIDPNKVDDLQNCNFAEQAKKDDKIHDEEETNVNNYSYQAGECSDDQCSDTEAFSSDGQCSELDEGNEHFLDNDEDKSEFPPCLHTAEVEGQFSDTDEGIESDFQIVKRNSGMRNDSVSDLKCCYVDGVVEQAYQQQDVFHGKIAKVENVGIVDGQFSDVDDIQGSIIPDDIDIPCVEEMLDLENQIDLNIFEHV